MQRPNFARLRAVRACAGKRVGGATARKLHFPASSWRQNYVARKAERDSPCLLTRLPPAGKTREMWGRWVRPLLRSEVLSPSGRFSPALRRGEERHRVARCLCSLWGGGAGLGERKARVPPPPSSPLRGLATLLPSLGVETGARASEGLSSRLALSLEPHQVSL